MHAGWNSDRIVCGSPTLNGKQRMGPLLMSPTSTTVYWPRPLLDIPHILTSTLGLPITDICVKHILEYFMIYIVLVDF